MKGFLNLNKIYIALAILLTFFLVGDLMLRLEVSKVHVLSSSYSLESLEYPILKSSFVPQISAKGAIVMDADSKVVLYSKNPTLRFSSASTTKIMTALTALDYFNLNDILTVKDATSEGVVLGLKEGQKITFENLLYALLLPSANDTAVAIAQNYPEGISSFVEKMNSNAIKYNLLNTHYDDPAGLEDDGDYTTPFDLAQLATIAIKNETFKKIVSTKQKNIIDESGNNYSVKNLNKLLGIEGVDGIKTGYTEGAGQVLVTSKEERGHTIIIIVMESENRFLDTEKLIAMISDNVTYLPIRP